MKIVKTDRMDKINPYYWKEHIEFFFQNFFSEPFPKKDSLLEKHDLDTTKFEKLTI